MRFRTYTLRIEKTSSAADPDATDGDALDRALCDAEDSVNNILPEGYYCKIDEVSDAPR